MNKYVIIVAYVMVSDILSAFGYMSDVRATINSAEIICLTVVTALYFGNYQERWRCVLQTIKFPDMASISQFNRRLHALRDWLDLILDKLTMLALKGEAFVVSISFTFLPVSTHDLRRTETFLLVPLRGHTAPIRAMSQASPEMNDFKIPHERLLDSHCTRHMQTHSNAYADFTLDGSCSKADRPLASVNNLHQIDPAIVINRYKTNVQISTSSATHFCIITRNFTYQHAAHAIANADSFILRKTGRNNST